MEFERRHLAALSLAALPTCRGYQQFLEAGHDVLDAANELEENGYLTRNKEEWEEASYSLTPSGRTYIDRILSHLNEMVRNQPYETGAEHI